MNENAIANKVIGAAIEVHRTLGPGLLESAYQDCLKYELNRIDLGFESESPVTLNYKGLIVGEAYRLDLLIENKVIIELKTVSTLLNIHKTQLLTYLRLTNKKLGLLINFNEILLKNGINRIVNNL